MSMILIHRAVLLTILQLDFSNHRKFQRITPWEGWGGSPPPNRHDRGPQPHGQRGWLATSKFLILIVIFKIFFKNFY